MKTRPSLLAAGLCLLLTGCATGYQIRVNALSDPTVLDRQSYYILPGLEELNPNDLQFREVAAYLRPMLAELGYREARRPDEADLALFVAYGMGTPEPRQYTYTYPVYAETGGYSQSVTTTTRDADGNPTTTTRTVSEPGRLQRVGTDITTETVVIYKKFLTLSARDNRTGDAPNFAPEVWHASAVSHDGRGELREIIPALVTALAPYVGRSTETSILLEIKERDPRLRALRSASHF